MSRPFGEIVSASTYTVTSSTVDLIPTPAVADEVLIRCNASNGGGVNVRLADQGNPPNRGTAATLYAGEAMQYETILLSMPIALRSTMDGVAQIVYVSRYR